MSVKDTERHAATKVIIEEYLVAGYNYRMTDVQAAIGVEQMKKLERFNGRRAELAARYDEAFASIPEVRPLARPPYDHVHAWHLYIVQVDVDALGIGRDDGVRERFGFGFV
jgi:UDP-4-amino-4-deoxy-L-arabinose-oxoglutarate aminotransferase